MIKRDGFHCGGRKGKSWWCGDKEIKIKIYASKKWKMASERREEKW